jgi:hypothetical protein
MLKFEQTFEFTLILRILRIIKIVTHLEILLQNVKRPKSGRNSGHVRNSGDYGTQFFGQTLFWVHFLLRSNFHLISDKKNCVPKETISYCSSFAL